MDRERPIAAGYTFVELLVVVGDRDDPGVGGHAAGEGDGDAAARGRAAPRAARDAHGDRQVQGRRRPAADRSLEIKVGQRRLSGGSARRWSTAWRPHNDATGRKLKFLRRDPGRSDDAQHRVGNALVPGQARTRRGGAARTSSTSTRRSTARRSTAPSTGLVRWPWYGMQPQSCDAARLHLIELMVVMSLIVILATIGLVQYRQSIVRRRKRC